MHVSFLLIHSKYIIFYTEKDIMIQPCINFSNLTH